MRQSIILPGKYQNVFLNEAEKSGLIEKLYNPADELYLSKEFIEAEADFKNEMNANVNARQNIYRILLLFDNIILSDVTKNYNYDKLKSTGLFSLFYFEDFYESDLFHKEDRIINATCYKYVILPVFINEIESYFKVGQPVGGFKSFASDLYDSILLNKKLPQKHNEFVFLNKENFNKRLKAHFDYLRSNFGKVPDTLTEKKRFFNDLMLILCNLYESLCWQLKISDEQNAAILNCDFQLAKMGFDEISNKANQSIEAYRILKLECSKIIGSLPTLNSIQEVINLKEQRYNDLHNLKQELSHLEDEIRRGNSQRAIEKAANDISKASKALSYGNIASKVSKWTNTFMIPVTVASFFLALQNFLCKSKSNQGKMWLAMQA